MVVISKFEYYNGHEILLKGNYRNVIKYDSTTFSD